MNKLQAPLGAHKKKKRVGRGVGSGHGKTSCRGHRGQRARSGSGTRPGFEGGQMPLSRRIPKRGFTNKFKQEFQIVNLKDLEVFDKKEVINIEILKKAGLIRKLQKPVKILGEGNISKALTVKAHRFSKSAMEKIGKAGGTAVIVTSNQ